MTSPAEDGRVPLPDGFSVPSHFHRVRTVHIDDDTAVDVDLHIGMVTGQARLLELRITPGSADTMTAADVDRLPSWASMVTEALAVEAIRHAVDMSADWSTEATVSDWLQQAGESIPRARAAAQALESPRAITPAVLAQVADAYERGGISAVQALRGGCSERNARRLLRRAREGARA